MSFKSSIQPKCRHCGKKIPKWTDRHDLWGKDAPQYSTKEELQRITNQKVVSVSYHQGKVCWFSTWDGESYWDEFFCKGRCAQAYGYRMASLMKHQRGR